MLKIAVCDDEQIFRNKIINALDEYSIVRDVEIEHEEYKTGLDILSSTNKYNIVFLDFQLNDNPEINGLSVARKYRTQHVDTAIIFLTSHPKVVFSSFEVNTFRFLVKPLDRQKLFKALDDYQKTLETDDVLMIRQHGATNIIYTRSILYLEGSGKYCVIHVSGAKEPIECHETLAGVEARLPADRFHRCHRSYVVNLKHIESYTHQRIALKNGASVDISRNHFEGFASAFVEYSRKTGF